MAQTEQDREWAEIVGWVLGLLGVAFLWKQKVRPWLDDQWGALQKGDSASVLGTSWDMADLVGLGALVVVLVVAVTLVRRSLRAKRAERKAARQQDEGRR